MNSACSSFRIDLTGFLVGLLFAVWPSAVAPAEPQDAPRTVFYVSTKGRDQWSGRLPAPDAKQQDGPFATLAAARNAIRRLRSENRLPGPVEVVVLGGTYHLAEPLVLTPEDTGTEKQPVTWSAYPGHRTGDCGEHRRRTRPGTA
jgi:hypothetical protein